MADENVASERDHSDGPHEGCGSVYLRAVEKLERIAHPPEGELVLALSRTEALALLAVMRRHA